MSSSLKREFPCRRASIRRVLFVSAQKRKLDRMNYHETWWIMRARKPPLNEEEPRGGGVSTVLDNNNVPVRQTRGRRG